MSIIGAHALLYTTEPDALRAMLRDVFAFRHVDAGDGWLIFELPPSEVGVHPADGTTQQSGGRHQLSLMCDDITETVRELRGKGVDIPTQPKDEGWGVSVMMNLPGGVQVMLYQPRHPTAVTFIAPEELR